MFPFIRNLKIRFVDSYQTHLSLRFQPNSTDIPRYYNGQRCFLSWEPLLFFCVWYLPGYVRFLLDWLCLCYAAATKCAWGNGRHRKIIFSQSCGGRNVGPPPVCAPRTPHPTSALRPSHPLRLWICWEVRFQHFWKEGNLVDSILLHKWTKIKWLCSAHWATHTFAPLLPAGNRIHFCSGERAHNAH